MATRSICLSDSPCHLPVHLPCYHQLCSVSEGVWDDHFLYKFSKLSHYWPGLSPNLASEKPQAWEPLAGARNIHWPRPTGPQCCKDDWYLFRYSSWRAACSFAQSALVCRYLNCGWHHVVLHPPFREVWSIMTKARQHTLKGYLLNHGHGTVACTDLSSAAWDAHEYLSKAPREIAHDTQQREICNIGVHII